MSDNDETPAHQHRTRGVTLDVLAERFDNFQHQYKRDWRELRDFMSEQREKHSEHVEAVAHCKAHDAFGPQIERIRNEDIPDIHSRITAISSGVTPASGSVSPAPVTLVAKTWPDVFFHPATPMAFCIVAMLIFFIVYASAKTGRDASTFVPHVTQPAVAP